MFAVVAFVAAILYLAAVYYTAELIIDDSELADVSLEIHSEYEIPVPSAALKFPLFFDKEIKSEITVTGSAQTEKLGQYKIEYNSQILGKNDFKEHVVNIVDTTPPELELDSVEFETDADSAPVTLDMINVGYNAWDNHDGDITSKVEKRLENDVCYYSVTDASGNTASAEVKIVYIDKKAPQIKLRGNTTVYMPINTEYKELGFTVTDNYDKNIASKVIVTNGVDVTKNGTYSVKYSVTDSSGNTDTAERRVIVYGGGYDEKYDTVKPNGKVIYLTFDDGPSIYTEKLLNILESYNVKATFFVTNQKPQYQNLISRMYKDGHTVAVHTYSHLWDIYSSVDSFMADFNAINSIIEKQTGAPSRIFRFPGGTNNKVSISYCEGIMTELSKYMLESGYSYFDWNVDSEDTRLTDSSDIITNLVKQIKNKKTSVILAHDIKKATVEAMPGFIEHCLKKGYSFSVITDNTEPVRFNPKN